MDQRKGYGHLINVIIIFGEFLLLNITFCACLFGFGDYLSEDVWDKLRVLFLLINVSYIPTLFLYFQKFHEKRILFSHKLIQNAFKIAGSHFLVFLSLMLLIKFGDLSRVFLATFYTIFFVALASWWLVMWMSLKQYRKSGYNFKNVVIVGSGFNADSLYIQLTSHDTYGYRVLGYFDDENNNSIYMNNYLGKVDSTYDYLEKNKVDELYCSLCAMHNVNITHLMEYCENHLIRFYLVPSFDIEVSRNMKMELLGEIPVLINRKEPLNDYMSLIIKRSFDIVFASVILFLSPLWLLPIAVAVKMSSPGPVFFKQLRTGRSGKDFLCYKFRSMRVNDVSDTVQATRNDPRKTKVGEFLRKTNLDEFPQFWNVLKGDMSIVGPRPHMLKHTESYSQEINKYMVRHYVKPGLTGWAQVNGYRGETKEKWQMEKRIEYDIWYLENWSFWLDVKIIMQTSAKMFHHDQNAF